MLTNVGRNKEAAALASGAGFDITDLAWGDGSRIPSGGEVALENELGRKSVDGRGVMAGSPNTAFFEILIAQEEGPFVIREVGLFDVDGDMIAVAYYDPVVNKPSGSVSVHLRINVVFSDLENLVIRIDSASSFVPAERQILTGNGLKGDGDLSADRMIEFNLSELDSLTPSAFTNLDRLVAFDESKDEPVLITAEALATLLSKTSALSLDETADYFGDQS
jgi:phage-related tail fiber protein